MPPEPTGEGDLTHLRAAADVPPAEQEYLAVLSKGANRLNVIASRLGLLTRTAVEVTESFLIRVARVAKDDQRRQLAAEGHNHFGSDRRNPGVRPGWRRVSMTEYRIEPRTHPDRATER